MITRSTLRVLGACAIAIGLSACTASNFDSVSSGGCDPTRAFEEPQARKTAFVQRRLCEEGVYAGFVNGVHDGESEDAVRKVTDWYRRNVDVADPPLTPKLIDERTMAAVDAHQYCVNAAAQGGRTVGDNDPRVTGCVAQRYPQRLADLRQDPAYQTVAARQAFDDAAPRTPAPSPEAAPVKAGANAAARKPALASAPTKSATTPAPEPTTIASTAPTASSLAGRSGEGPQRPSKVGERILALESVECKPRDEVWLLYYVGEVTDLSSERVTLRLDKRYGLWYDYNGAGIDDTNWFCAPDKRICFSEVAWEGWGGKRRQGELVVVPSERAFAGGDQKLNHATLGDYGAMTRCPTVSR